MKTQAINCFRYCAFALVLLFVSSSCSDDDDAPSNNVSIKSISPESPASLNYFETSIILDRVLIEYDHTISYEGGARIWIQPITNGAISPGYVYSPSNVYTGKGSRAVVVSVSGTEGAVKVDQLLIVAKDPDQNTTIFEKYIDVDYTFQ